MPQIRPFRPYRYQPLRIPSLGAVIAPPYDVISPEQRAELLARDPHNVIALILPEGSADDRYASAGRLFHSWIDEGVLVREEQPAVYPYAQTFTDPRTGDRVQRRGIIAVLRLVPFSAGEVLPHERTLSGPKADRLSLMLTTDANLEPIFGVYRDPSGASAERLAAVALGTEPMLAVVDRDGVEHRLWRADDSETIEAFAADVAPERVFIVDGHHRYETALEYRKQMHARRGVAPDGTEALDGTEAPDGTEGPDEASGSAPYDSIMIFLAPSSDPGLLILPTHRVVHALPAFDFDRLLEALRPHFVLTEQGDCAAAVDALARHADTPAYLLATRGRTVLAALREGISLDELVSPALPEALKGLDVTILHDHILESLLGISREAQAEQRNLRYVKSAEDAFAAADADDVQCVVLMNPTRLEQVEAVAQTGEVMPQKSTFFYPKLASGLLFNPLWES